MRSLVIAVVLGVAASAQAQPASALGNPLPSPNLATGTVSVRVVAGSPANLVIGTDVTLLVNGAPRVARTDTTGHAIFKDLPANASVQAKVIDEDKKEVASTTFPLPADSGVTVMLSTKPWNPGAAGGPPFAGGGQGMPEPRQLSGEVRPEQNDPAGTFTVRLTYDDFKDAPPVGVPVTLVGYGADDHVSIQTTESDKDGRAQFSGLDRTGATSYFALAQLPRNGGVDRLMSQPAVLDSQAGVRVALSADKRTSNAQPIDELERIEHSQATPAGKVRVVVEGESDVAMEVELIDARTRSVLAKGTPAPGAPDPTNVAGRAHFAPSADVPAGTLDVQAHGGQGPTNNPLEGVGVRVIPADAKAAPADLVASKTPTSGTLRLALAATSGKVKAILTINGRDFVSEPFELAQTGGVLDVEAHWEDQGKPQVTFDLPAAGQTLYAEATVGGKVYRSVPFQPADGHGTQVSVFALPVRILFSFSWRTQINDEFLLVGGRFEIYNNSWAPYVAGPDGLVVPLPKGFKSAQLDNRDKADVAIGPEGFRLVRPVPPGQRQFHGQFALPVDAGTIKWALDLPYGALQSGMQIDEIPGMNVELGSKDVQGESMTVPEGTFFVIPQINIRPGQSMVMTITGLPAAPAWQTWVPRIVGITVVAMMATGLGFALRRKRPDRARAERRAKLLDELVELDRAGKPDKRRDAVLAELEQLWD